MIFQTFFAFLATTILVGLPIASSSIVINEIMYAPPQDDSYNEWMELYNPTAENISLEGWKICNNQLLTGYINRTGHLNLNDTFIVPADGYAVITDGGSGTEVYDNFNVSGIAFHVEASSICGGLSNSGKTVLLYNGSLLTNNVTYSSSQGADSDGNSLQLVENNWISCSPTPGFSNCATPNQTATTTTSTTLPNQTTTTSTAATSTVPSSTTALPNTCDLSLVITTNQSIYNTDAALEYKVITEDVNCQNFSHNFKIAHWIEDLYGNMAKEAKTSQGDLTCKRTKTFQWTPKNLVGSEGYLIKAKIVDFGCADSNATNDDNEKLIVVKGNLSATSTTLITATTQKPATTTSTTTTLQNRTTTTPLEEPKTITGRVVNVWDKVLNFFKSLFSWLGR